MYRQMSLFLSVALCNSLVLPLCTQILSPCSNSKTIPERINFTPVRTRLRVANAALQESGNTSLLWWCRTVGAGSLQSPSRFPVGWTENQTGFICETEVKPAVIQSHDVLNTSNGKGGISVKGGHAPPWGERQCKLFQTFDSAWIVTSFSVEFNYHHLRFTTAVLRFQK